MWIIDYIVSFDEIIKERKKQYKNDTLSILKEIYTIMIRYFFIFKIQKRGKQNILRLQNQKRITCN